MYQQYVNEVRVTQYQQQCQREAAIERLWKASRPMPAEVPGGPAAAAWALSVTTWLRRRILRPAASH